MAIYSTASINFDNVKIRWTEPYASSAINKKTFGVIPKGIYEGFVIGPGGLSTRDIIINTGTVSGGLGTGMIGGYVSGNFDEAILFSIAVHQNSSGWQTTVNMPPGSLPAHLDATGLNGLRVYMVIDVVYNLNQATTAFFRLVNSTQIDSNPSYVVIGYCDIPSNPSTPLDATMFGYNDPVYPRTTPLATTQKAGLMPTSVWSQLGANASFPFQTLLYADLDPNNSSVLEITPSQKLDSNGRRLYTFIQPNITSKFPRSAAGIYNGGALNDQYTKLNFITGTISGAHLVTGNTTFAIGSIAGQNNSYQVAIVTLNVSDNLSVTYGSVYNNSTTALLDDNIPVVSSSLLQICLVLLSTNSSGVIQPLTSTSIWDRRPFLNLGGGGSSSGGSNSPASGYLSIVTDKITQSPSFDPNIDITHTNGTNDPAKNIYSLKCDKTKTVTTAGTTYTFNSAPSYPVLAGDIIFSGGTFRTIAAVTTNVSGTLDVAFTANLTTAACMVSQAVYTNDLVNVGDAVQLTRPKDFFPATNVLSINVNYHDSLASGDGTPDYTATANVVCSASNSGLQSDVGLALSNTFTGIFTRPAAPAQLVDYPLSVNTNTQRLFLVFFPNPNNSSVTITANLCDFAVSFYADIPLLNGGFLQSAFTMSDGSGVPFGISMSVSGGLSYATLTNTNFIPNLNPGGVQGDGLWIVNGQVIPRQIVGTTQDAWYAEVPGSLSQVKFWMNLSSSHFSVNYLRFQGQIDTSGTNARRIAGLQELIVGTNTQVSGGQADYSSLQLAHNALPSTGGIIQVIGNPTAGGLSITKAGVSIIGKGYSTQVSGAVTFVSGANHCLMKWLRLTGNVVINSNYNFFSENTVDAGFTVTLGAGTSGNYDLHMPV